MICANCGTDNAAGTRFCIECATPLALVCPSCGSANLATAKFCGQCATPLTEAVGAAARVAPAAAAETAPQAERRLVSVLFADIVGFTPLVEERDPEAVRELLTRYFDACRLAVERHGGTVEKFIGDAVMAVWGAPVAREDDAERAVRAALEIIDAARSLGAGIEARAGVLSGEAAVTLGAVGQGMVAGDLVNTASRLQSVAPVGTVLVGEATMRAAAAAITFETVGPQELKGKASPVPAWRALRVVAQRGGQGRAEAPEPPFVGREEELRLLKDALHGTGREGRVRLISITGPAGIGKSRLAWELEKYLDGVVEEIHWHRGRSPSYGEGIAFWALGEMVRRRAGLAEGDDEATTRARVVATVAEYIAAGEDRRWVEPALLALLGLEPAPAGGRDALFAGWRIFFESIGRKGTTVLLFEDLQWADSGLLDFIDHLVEWSKRAPLLIITLARPELFERRPDWGAGKRHVTALALEPLSSEDMGELLAGFVPGLPDRVVETILARADGIPLYAVETVRMLVADGRLERSDGVYRSVGDLSRLAIPDTLRSLIASRLDGLEVADRRLLQDAAVLGRSFTPAALAAIAATSEAELEPHLRGLARRELLELVADPRSPERGQYGFVQSLIREVAYDTLARRDRRSRHLAAARYFETLGDDELAGVLASHYLAAYEASAEGGEADALAAQARLSLRGAAERAAGLGGHDQAVSYLEQALTITREPAERAELLHKAATSADAGGRYEAAAGYARSAVEAYRDADDPLGTARSTALLGWITINQGDAPGAMRLLQDALGELPAEEEGSEVQAFLLVHLSRAAFRAGKFAQAIEVADRALPIAERLNLDSLIAEAFTNRGAGLNGLGRRREAEALYEAAVRLAQAGGWISTELRARHNLADSISNDDPRRGVEVYRSALDLARRVGERGMGSWLAGTVALSVWALGAEWDETLTDLEEALGWATAESDRFRLMACGGFLRTERGEAPDDLLTELDSLAARISDPGLLSLLELLRSAAALLRDDLDGAYRCAVRALDKESSFGMVGVSWAFRGALWAGDLSRVRALAERSTAVPYHDPWSKAHRALVAAGLAALEGRRDESVAGYRRALGAFRALGFDFDLALGGLSMLIALGTGEPEALAAAEEARAIFERVGARPQLDRLDAVLAAGPGAVSAPRTVSVVPSG